MFVQILKTKEVPEKDINDMISGEWLRIKWCSMQEIHSACLISAYQHYTTEDTDEENINYYGGYLPYSAL